MPEENQSRSHFEESQNHFRLLFENMPSGAAIYEAIDNGADFIFKDLNKAAEKLENLKTKDIVGKRVTEVFPGVKEFGVFDVFQRVYKTGKPEFFPVAIYQDETRFPTHRENWVYKLPSGEIIAIYNNVTDFIITGNALKESERKFQTVMNTIQEVFWMSTYGVEKVLYISPAYETIWERSRERLLESPKSFLEAIHPEDLNGYLEKIERYHKNGLPYEHEYRIIKKNGSIRWIHERGYPSPITSDKERVMAGVCSDITKQKESNKLINDLSKFPEQNKNPVYRVSKEGILLYANPAGRELTDKGQVSLGEKIPQEWLPMIENVWSSKTSRSVELEFNNRVFLFHQVPVLQEGYINIYAADITEQKQKENEYRIIKERLDFALKGSKSGTWDWDIKNDHVIFDELWADMIGYTTEELEPTSKIWVHLLHPDDKERIFAELNKHFTDPDYEYKVEFRLKCKNGQWKWTLASGQVFERDSDGNPVRMIGIHVDINERKKIEEQLKNNKKFLDQVGKMARVGGWELDIKTKEVFFTSETYNIHEIPENKKLVLSKALEFFDKPTRKDLEEAIDRCIEDGTPYDLELPFTTANGNHLWAHTRGNAIKEGDKIIKLRGTFQDITDKKEQEQMANAEKKKFIDAINAISDTFFVLDREGHLITWNKATEDVSGYSKEELHDKSAIDFFEGEDKQKVLNAIIKTLETGKTSIELDFVNKTAEKMPYYFSASRLEDEDGNVIGIAGIGRDISDRKKSERELHESAQKFESLASNIPGVVYRCLNDVNWTMQFMSEEIESITGYSKDSFIDNKVRSYASIIHQDDKPIFNETVQKAIQEKRPYEINYRVINKSGQEVPVHERGQGIYNVQGELACLNGVIFDMSREKEYRDKIKESQKESEKSKKLLNNIINLLPLRVFWKCRNLKYLGCNQRFAEDAGKTSPNQMIGKDDFEMGWKDQAEIYRADDLEVIESGKSKINIEEPQTTPSGETIWLSTSKVPLTNEEGDIIGMLGVYDDITQRKAADEELKDLLKDLQQFKEATIDRENKMIELKAEINKLSNELKRPEPYDLSFLNNEQEKSENENSL